MRILVTGSQGYIGSVLVPALRQAGHTVVGLDSGFFADCLFGSDLQEDGELLNVDVRDVRQSDLNGFDAVVHLAALSNDPLGNLDPQLTTEINFEASLRLARLAKQAGVERFVFSSSCSSYGAGGATLLDEEAPCFPVAPYGESKVRTDAELGKLADDRFSPVSMRNATAYGLSPRLRLDLVLNDFVATACATGCVSIKSDGLAWRPVVHVEDICRAMLAVIEAPRSAIHNQAFNVGRTDENFQIRDLADVVARTVPACRVEYASGGTSDPRCYRVNCDKLLRVLPGFRLQWNVSRGVRQLYEGFSAAGIAGDALHGMSFFRLRKLQHLLSTGRIDSTLRWRRHDVPETTA